MAIICSALMGVKTSKSGVVEDVQLAVLNWPLPGIAPTKAIYFKDVCESAGEQRLTVLAGEDDEIELVWPEQTNCTNVFEHLKSIQCVTIYPFEKSVRTKKAAMAYHVPLLVFEQFADALLAHESACR